MEIVRVLSIAALTLIVAAVLFCGGCWYYVGHVSDSVQAGRDAAERARAAESQNQ